MATAIWSSVAERDLADIVYYIAVVDARPAVAEKIALEIKDACQWYADHSLVGEAESRLGASMRRFTHRRWIILYRPEPSGIGIVPVIDGARDFDRLFGAAY